MESADFRDGVVSTEGDGLYYKVRGEGKPIIFIAPAGGDGDGYYPVAKALSDTYKVITYDRRANARSTMNFPNHFDIRQQSRDALAVLRAAGEDSAVVVGNSSGAVIALDMAAAYPGAVHAAIVHEAAAPCVLPDAEAEKWAKFFKDCYDVGKQKGASRGAIKFYFGIELPSVRLMIDTLKVYKYRKQDEITCDVKYMPSKAGSEFLLFQELLPITNYKPDFESLKSSGVKIYIGIGTYGLTRNTWYARAAKIIADRLACELVIFPGHHGEFMGSNYMLWANVVRETVQKSGW